MSTTQGSTFDPHQILHRSGECPPAAALRHHRRSVDRIWPPALEVRLARLSIDEGPAAGAHTHIIPAPPPVGSKDPGVDSTGWAMNDHRLEPIKEGVAISPPAVGGGVEDTTALSERRRLSSVFGPLSPHYLLDEQHFPPYHQPRIDVQYRKRCKSISSLGSSIARPDGKSNTTVGGVHGNDARGDGTKSFKEKSANTRHLSLLTSASHSPASSVPSIFTIESDEFGPDLFHQRSPSESLCGLSRSSSLAEFQKTLFQQQPGPMGQLSVPRGEVASIGRQDEGLRVVPLDLPPPHPHSRPSYSPMSKNPLSPSSSRNTSPAHTPQRLRSPSPLTRVRSPLRDSNRHNIQLNSGSKHRFATQPQAAMPQSNLLAPITVHSSKRFLRLHDESSSGGQVLGVLTQRSGAIHDDQENILTESPIGCDITLVEPSMSLEMIPNDHERWRSPTLSALASQNSSRGPSSPWQELPYTEASVAPKSRSMHGRQRRELASQLQNDMEVEIPLIEAHDQVLLQDIWRMEDEERRDRLNGVTEDHTASKAESSVGRVEDPIAHMKGEQHAHEEARLVQRVLHAGHS
ncbi:unnamed protein product [Mortierella alpina]